MEASKQAKPKVDAKAAKPAANPSSPKPNQKPELTDVGLTAKKAENFSDWYTQVVIKSELADYSIVSGCMVIRPLGMSIWDNIRCACEPRLKELGVQNAYFLFSSRSLS